MTKIQTMEIATANTASGSYEVPGSSNVPDAYLVGDAVATDRFPANTLDAAVTVG